MKDYLSIVRKGSVVKNKTREKIIQNLLTYKILKLKN